MLYVPLFFYIFDRLKERGERKRRTPTRRHVTRRPERGHQRPRRGPRATRAMNRHPPRGILLALALVEPAARWDRITRGRRSMRPAAFRFEPKAVAETANTAWWKQFNDPVLDQLIDTALANNLNVKVAAANVEQAAGVSRRPRSGLFRRSVTAAQASAHARPNPEQRGLPGFSCPNPQTAYQAGLTASWEIDLWGRIQRLSEAARANLARDRRGRRGVILTLVSSVADQLPHAARPRRAAGDRRIARSPRTPSRCGCTRCSSSTGRPRR
jgi:hypothetical protein